MTEIEETQKKVILGLLWDSLSTWCSDRNEDALDCDCPHPREVKGLSDRIWEEFQ